jgi:hypothetical protein
MRLGAGLPVWVLRGTVLAAVGLIVILLLAEGVATAPLVAVGVFGLLSALVPASPAPAFVIVATAVAVAITRVDPFTVPVLAMLPLVHIVHLGSAVAATVPATARVHLVALRPALIRLAAVQAGVFTLAGVAAMVPKGVTPMALEVAGLAGVAVLAVVAARLVMKR